MSSSLTSIVRRALAGAALTAASAASYATPVDLQLSLVIDISGSVSTSEYNLQMDGYAQSFRDATVQQNLLAGANGASAVNVVFFASNFFTALYDFQVLDSVSDINMFADTLDNITRPGGGGTDIFDGVNRAIDLLLADDGITSSRKVIDVSGDGTDSTSRNRAARDRAAASSITVNGLAIESNSTSTRITDFFTDNVVTEDGFVRTSASFSDFEAAVLEKVRAETVVVAQVPTPATLSLMAFGGLLLTGVRARRRA